MNDVNWRPLGAVRLDPAGRLEFPTAPMEAGLYLLTVDDAVYIGTSEVLRRSLQHIRTPGDREVTHLRLRDCATDALRVGKRVTVAVCTDLGGSEDRSAAAKAALDRRVAAGLPVLNLRW